jgi:transposase-like protein
MMTPAAPPTYKNPRFPVEIISHAVWLYFRGGLVMPPHRRVVLLKFIKRMEQPKFSKIAINRAL